ncbi:MAG: isoprenylcysteine carboxylmethyltransferase family protein [bacterium]|nr:isoprenylcysteine carboxylmethyltransferase family protein [bacterium]
MGDPSKFQNIIQYYLVNSSFLALLLAEIVILIVTHQKTRERKKRDNGTRWMLIGCFAVCIYLSIFFVSQSVPAMLRALTFPKWASWIGILMIVSGIIIRLIAVFTLKSAFTLNVQTTNTQKLITKGIYHSVRNPAYTGSILSLLGIAVSYRSLVAIVLVLLISMICYSVRIHIEEQALEAQFGEEFTTYCKRSWRLVPCIW